MRIRVACACGGGCVGGVVSLFPCVMSWHVVCFRYGSQVVPVVALLELMASPQESATVTYQFLTEFCEEARRLLLLPNFASKASAYLLVMVCSALAASWLRVSCCRSLEPTGCSAPTLTVRWRHCLLVSENVVLPCGNVVLFGVLCPVRCRPLSVKPQL